MHVRRFATASPSTDLIEQRRDLGAEVVEAGRDSSDIGPMWRWAHWHA